MTALLVIFLCLAAIVPYRYIAPVYARSAWTTDERQAIRGSLDVDMGGQVRLVGYDLSESAVSPGERLWVTLYWEALQTMGQDYSVFIHLVDDRGVTIVQCDIGQIDVRKG